MKKKVVRKRVAKKAAGPVVQKLSFRDKLIVKLMVFKARFNSFFYSLKAKVRGY